MPHVRHKRRFGRRNASGDVSFKAVKPFAREGADNAYILKKGAQPMLIIRSAAYVAFRYDGYRGPCAANRFKLLAAAVPRL